MGQPDAVALAASILRTFDAVTATGEAVQRHVEETESEVARLWRAIADLRDDQHEGLTALSNRLQNLTTAVTTEPAEVAAKIVNDANRETEAIVSRHWQGCSECGTAVRRSAVDGLIYDREGLHTCKASA